MSPTTSTTRLLADKSEPKSVTSANRHEPLVYPFKSPLNAWERLTLGALHIFEAVDHHGLLGEFVWNEVPLSVQDTVWALSLLLAGSHWRGHPQVADLLKGTLADKLFLAIDGIRELNVFVRQAVVAKNTEELLAAQSTLAIGQDLTPLQEVISTSLFARARTHLVRDFPFDAVDAYYRRELMWQRFHRWLSKQSRCVPSCGSCCAPHSASSVAERW